jgi:hypothetical protein
VYEKPDQTFYTCINEEPHLAHPNVTFNQNMMGVEEPDQAVDKNIFANNEQLKEEQEEKEENFDVAEDVCQDVASDAQIAEPEEEIELGDHHEAMNEE